MTTQRILVVEDEEDILELLLFILRRDNNWLTGAKSGEEAMAILACFTLPGTSPTDTFEETRAHTDTKTDRIHQQNHPDKQGIAFSNPCRHDA